MIRTTPELVAGILLTAPTVPVDPFVLAASILVDRIEEDSASPSGEVLTVIETWLAAHFYCIRLPRRESERAGDVWATYMSKVDLNLSVTHYGQQAMVLDPTGTLKALNEPKAKNKRRVGVHYVGGDCDCE